VRHRTYPFWKFMIQRSSRVVALIFIAVHVYQSPLQVFLGEDLHFQMVEQSVAHPFWLVFWIVGVVATVFHFANGLWTFMITLGITQSEKSQQVMSYITVLVFLVISTIGVMAIFAFV